MVSSTCLDLFSIAHNVRQGYDCLQFSIDGLQAGFVVGLH